MMMLRESVQMVVVVVDVFFVWSRCRLVDGLRELIADFRARVAAGQAVQAETAEKMAQHQVGSMCSLLRRALNLMLNIFVNMFIFLFVRST